MARPSTVLFATTLLSFTVSISAQQSDVLARVGDRTLTRAEVSRQAAAPLEQAELRQLQCESEAERASHEVIEGAVQQSVRQMVLEAEAKSRGIDTAQVLAELKPPTVTEEEVNKFYEENKERVPQGMTKEQVVPEIRNFMMTQKHQEAQEAFYASLMEKHKAQLLVEPFRAKVEAVGPSRGPANAPVTIVEFSDFECPFCSRFLPSLEKVRSEFGDKVRIVFRHYPLNSIHPNAQRAAEASMCANDQGKFWEMHDLLFADRTRLAVDGLKKTATELKLDLAKFNSCLESGKYGDVVRADLRAGARAGVSGTPAVFINGRYISGAAPFEQLAPVIREELAKKGVK